MEKQQVFDALRAAIADGEPDAAAQAARQLVEDRANVLEALEVATAAIRLVGDRFQEGTCFLPELVTSADAMQAFLKVLLPHLRKDQVGGAIATKVVLATVKGDIHDIGKNIVGTMLKVSGFDVIDLGVNASPMKIIETAEDAGARFIGLSALMTTSVPFQQEVLDLLRELKLRQNFFVVLGGGPVTRDHAQTLGADGWAQNAVGAVRLMERLAGDPALTPAAQFVYEEN